MPKIDMNVYAATQDSPGGPVIVQERDLEGALIEPVRDEHGNITVGGQIGYSLALIIMLGLFLYVRFAV